jgi:heat shock protein HslJ
MNIPSLDFGRKSVSLCLLAFAGLVFFFLLYLFTPRVIAPPAQPTATTTVQVATTSLVTEDVFQVENDTIPMALDIKPWKWVSVTYGDGTVVTPAQIEVFSIRFNSSGAFTAETDCNSISGSYEARNGALSLGSIASTKMFCEGSQEGEFTALLSDVSAYRFVEGGQLIMTTSKEAEVIFK